MPKKFYEIDPWWIHILSRNGMCVPIDDEVFNS
jgi:hypothetical protein